MTITAACGGIDIAASVYELHHSLLHRSGLFRGHLGVA